MMTLDDVIEAMERCSIPHYFDCKGCPYEDDDAEVGCRSDDRDADALHYLKEYRSDKAMWEADRKGLLNWIEQYKEAHEKHQQAVIELKKNPPLTWDELRTMKGKPVFVEGSHGPALSYKGWALISFNRQGDDMKCQLYNSAEFWIGEEDYGTDWQAYRKER